MKPTIKQQLAIDYLTDTTIEFVGYGGAAGGGKIVSENDSVLSSVGWIKNKDLSVGKFILNPDGSTQKIIQIKPWVELEKWTVFFSDGTKLEVASDHLWQAWRARKSIKKNRERISGINSAEVVETKTLKEWLDKGYSPQIPVTHPLTFTRASKEKNQIEPYVLGVLLGDGCLTIQNNIITSDVKDIPHYISEFLLNKEDYTVYGNTIRFVGEFNKYLNEKLKKYGLKGTKSHNKFIPSQYLWGSIDKRISVLQGLLDTDGHSSTDKNQTEYSTTSKRLSEDVCFIVRSLGGTAKVTTKTGSYTKNKKKIECKKVYRVWIRMPNPDSLFRMTRKKKGVFGRNLIQKKVIDVKVGGRIKGRCITVSNPNGLYITNDFIVTHNSYIGCYWLMQMGYYVSGSKYFIGRDSLKDTKASVLKTWAKLAQEIGFTAYKFSGDGIVFDNGSEIELLDLSFYPQKDPLFERLGSKEYTAGWVEEASQVHPQAFEILKTRIGRWMNEKIKKKILCTFNPKKNWVDTTFYRPFINENLPKDTQFVYALPTDNPHLPKDYLETLRNLKDKATRERLLNGNFDYDDDPTALIDYDRIKSLWTNNHIQEGKKCIISDIARFGSDKAIVVVWYGFIVKEYFVFATSKTTDIQNCINAMRIKHGISANRCVADEDGVGGGVVDSLGIKGFVNNSRPNNPSYQNLKTECGYKLAEMVGQIYFEADVSSDVQESIEKELGQLKTYDADKDGKLRLLPKEKIKHNIGRSPDWLDTFIMRMYFEIKPHEGEYYVY